MRKLIVFALVFGCSGPSSSPVVEPAVVEPAVSAGCERDEDCVLSGFDCSECGRCPDTPPWAATAEQLAEAERECAAHPPVRMIPNAGELGLDHPACSPCPDVPEMLPSWRAVCREASCMAEPIPGSERPTALAYTGDLIPGGPSTQGSVIDHAATADEAPGEAGCEEDSDCVLTTWICSPCGAACPGTMSRAMLKTSLDAAIAGCVIEGPPPACGPCQGEPPGFRDWTAVSCRGGTCVAHSR
jgi:hypothetical protein